MHSEGNAKEARALVVALQLILAYVLLEIVVSILSGSLALLADAGHQLADAGAIGGALISIALSNRPTSERWTYGMQRAEVLSTALNGVVLGVVAAFVGTEAIRRLIDPGPVAPVGVIAVAGVGLFVNLAATIVMARADSARMDVKGVVLHLLTDVWGTGAALIAGVVILVTGFERADAIASVVVVAIMARACVKLLNRSGRVLFEGTPDDLSLVDVRSHILGIENVLEVHDLHAWLVATGLPTLSAHIVVKGHCFLDGSVPTILDQLQDCLAGHFDLEHSTFQLEPPGHASHETLLHRDHLKN